MDFQVLNTEDTISRLITLIREAKERLTLISPYVTLLAEDRVGRAVREALSRKVKVSIVVRRDDQTPLKEGFAEAMRPLVEMGLQLFGVPGLHAKLYRSESTVLVTSLNLLGSSFLNTIEIGLWSQDPRALRETEAFIKREIAAHAQPVATKASQPARPAREGRERKSRADHGFCIRCGDEVPLNPAKPYCRTDYEEWAEWGNEDYVDEYCHACGDPFSATMAKPLCGSCYRALA